MLTNNDIARRLRYLFDFDDKAMLGLLQSGGKTLSRPQLLSLLRREGEPEYLPCDDATLEALLDGFIRYRRGARDNELPPPPRRERLNNNLILRKLRIALSLDEDAMLRVFQLSGLPLSRSELSALFRRPEHVNYRPCGDQALRNFLTGLEEYLASQEAHAKLAGAAPKT